MIARGCVSAMHGGLCEVVLPGAAIGAGVRIEAGSDARSGTVCGLNGPRALVALHGESDGIACGMRAESDERALYLPLGACALGRSFDASGASLDDRSPICGPRFAVAGTTPMPDERRPVREALWTGVKAIDAFATIGVGARVGLFGAPGVGKSTLLETIVEGARADAVVVALVGERGREAQRWIASCNARTSIVCATSDRPAPERVRAAHVALAQAQALARRGLNVVVVFDSLARFASAVRELVVAAGEPVGRGGYPPSVFASLAQLVERCGAWKDGSITLLATVLSDGDDRDPVSEAARALLDGHIELSGRLARTGRFPAIDVPASVSRTMAQIADPAHIRAANAVRAAIALLESVADARRLGVCPTDAPTLRAIDAEARIEAFLRQAAGSVAYETTLRALGEIADTSGEPYGYSD